MANTEVASKGAQGGLFLLAGLCFLLPFVSLSCASEEAAEGMEVEVGDQTLSGLQLVTGGERRESFDPSGPRGPSDPDAEPEFEVPAEPFAVIAFASALAGLILIFVRVTRTRLLGATIAGAAGAGSLVLLAMSPTLRALGLSAVALRYGFWVTLGVFGLAAGLHLVQLGGHRRTTMERPPAPPPRPPPPSAS